MVAPQGPPTVLPTFISLTCGQDIKVPTLLGLGNVLMQCFPFNGSQPLTMQVYKDGELIPGASFPYTIVFPNDDDFGTYTFVLSTERCGLASAVSRILRQGQPVIPSGYLCYVRTICILILNLMCSNQYSSYNKLTTIFYNRCGYYKFQVEIRRCGD